MHMESIIKMMLMMAVTMALTIALTMRSIQEVVHKDKEDKPPFVLMTSSMSSKGPSLHEPNYIMPPPSKRLSRFLAGQEGPNPNPRAADHCRRDNEICHVKEGGNSTCCNNKCIDLATNKNNCGACKHKCKATETCCRGECVELAYDKRHCGVCNHRCMPKGYCIYGFCDYA